MPSIPFHYYDEEEQRRLEAEAAATEQQSAPQPQQPTQSAQPQTVREAAEGAEKQQGEEGFFSQLGEAIKEEGDILQRVDRFLERNANLTENIPIIGDVNRAAADFVPSREQFDESVADVPVLGQARAAGAGADAFFLTPLTLGARATNQSTEFAELPAELDEVVGGEIAFEVGRLLAPSLVGLPAIASTGTRITAESALETINQRSADDLIMGREGAIKLGEIADLLGYDGKTLTRQLIEGKEPKAQAIVAVAGFLQNFGINLTAETLIGKIGKLVGKATAKPSTEAVAEGTQLFHGTSAANAASIAEGGFRESRNGVFGRGVYLTESSEYASSYAAEEGLGLLSDADFQRYLDGDEALADPGLLVGGSLPSNIRILDIPNSGMSAVKFARRLGMKGRADGAVRFIREYARKNNFDGVRFDPVLDAKPGKGGMSEVILFDASKADQVVAGKSSVVEQIAQRTGKSVEDVQASLDDINLPAGKGQDYDIYEQTTIDTGVAKPKGKKDVINEDAIQATSLRRSNDPLLEDALSEADHQYFVQLDRLSDERSFREALAEGTKYIDALKKSPADKQAIIKSAQEWTQRFFDSSTKRFDFDNAIDDFAANMTEPLRPAKQAFDDLLETGLDKAYLMEGAIATPEGALVAKLIGEELSIRLHRAARSVMNMENGGKNWEAAVEKFLQLQDKGELFLTPLRRYRRKWNVSGEVIQKESVRKAGSDAPIKGSKGNKEVIPYDAPSENFRTIKKDPDDTGSTLREMLDIYTATGDKDIKKSIDAYFTALSYSPPKVAIQMMDNVSGTMRQQLRKGNKDAYRQLLYSAYLTRLAPQTASVISNIANLIKEPVGLAMSGQRAYARGQIMGAWSVMSDAFQVGKRAFQKGDAINSGTKLDASVYDFKQKQQALEGVYQGAKREINLDTTLSPGQKKLQETMAWWNYTRQSIANHPLNSYASRLFLAGDEWSKVLYGGMTAGGRAYREGVATGAKGSELERLVHKHMGEIFQEGTNIGKINTDKDAVGDVLGAANSLTFSNPIPKNGNVIDQAFRSLQDAGRDSAFWNFTSPFTRVSYWTMEKGGVLMAGALPMPKRTKEWMLGAIIPRYRKTLNGEYGELAQLQLKGDIAFAHYTAFMVGGLSTMGLMTGNNPPEGMPKTSFIIPTDNKNGYVAIPYGRIEPIATMFAVVADSVKAFRDNDITEGEYLQIIQDIAVAAGLATMDKSFMTGMSNTSNLLDIKNFTPTSATRSIVSSGSGLVASQFLPLGGAAGLTRMVTEWVQPYETISMGDANNWRNLFSAIAQRNFGGLTNPVKNDPLTGNPIPKSINSRDIMGAALGEGLVPGRIKQGENQDIYRELEFLGYESKRFIDNTRTANGIPLSLENQSHLQADLHTYGGLSTRLRNYFQSNEYKNRSRQLEASRQDTSMEGQMRTERLERELRQRVDYYYGQAKQRAISQGRVGRDRTYQQNRRTRDSSRNPASLRAEQSASEPNPLERVGSLLNMYK